MKIRSVLAVLLITLSMAARGQTCTASISDVDFGTPNLLSTTATDVNATLTVNCTSVPLLASIKVCPSLSEGSGGAAGGIRLMDGPGNQTLSYQLFQDATRTQGWGASDNLTLGTVPFLSLPGGLTGTSRTTRTIYARLFGNQSTVEPGTFTSEFESTETAFQYSSYYFSTSENCSGWVGTRVVRPTFTVSAELSSYCRVSTADIAFGTVGVLAAAITANGKLTLACTRSTPYVVYLNGGLSGAPPTARRMTRNAEAVLYGLYRDAARTQAWGDVSTPGSGLAGTGTGGDQVLTVYGRIAPQPTPSPGAYSDRIIVTVVY